MADNYTATYEPIKRTLCPSGLQQVVCVDGIFLGHAVDQYPGNPPRLVEKYVLVFQTADFDPATQRRFELSREFTVSMGKKAGLRKFLSDWRGRQYTDEDARRVELHKTMGVNGMATVEHKTSGAGNEYAKVTNIAPLMRGLSPIQSEGYERAPFWEEKKQEYKAAADAFLTVQEVQQAASRPAPQSDEAALAGAVAAVEDESDALPFN